MPLYEYQCDACGKRFEAIQKFSDPAPDACRLCGHGPVQRLLSSPAIQFKGSGWYITDYSQKGKEPGKKSDEKSGEKSSEKSGGDAPKGDSAKADSSTTKSESKSDSSAGSSTTKSSD